MDVRTPVEMRGRLKQVWQSSDKVCVLETFSRTVSLIASLHVPDATHLYKRSCPAVRSSVCPMLFLNDEKRHFT